MVRVVRADGTKTVQAHRRGAAGQGPELPAPERSLFDWDIFRIGGRKAQRLGYVTAADATQAVKRAIDEFNIPYADRLRIMAQRNDSYSV